MRHRLEIAHRGDGGPHLGLVVGVEAADAREHVDHRKAQRLVDLRVEVAARRARVGVRCRRARDGGRGVGD